MDVFYTVIDIISVCGSIPIEIPILWPRAVMVGPRPRVVPTLPLFVHADISGGFILENMQIHPSVSFVHADISGGFILAYIHISLTISFWNTCRYLWWFHFWTSPVGFISGGHAGISHGFILGTCVDLLHGLIHGTCGDGSRGFFSRIFICGSYDRIPGMCISFSRLTGTFTNIPHI